MPSSLDLLKERSFLILAGRVVCERRVAAPARRRLVADDLTRPDARTRRPGPDRGRPAGHALAARRSARASATTDPAIAAYWRRRATCDAVDTGVTTDSSDEAMAPPRVPLEAEQGINEVIRRIGPGLGGAVRDQNPDLKVGIIVEVHPNKRLVRAIDD